MAEFSTAAEVLGAMITPAVLISASGTLVLSTSNRLVRVVDRVRVLSKDAARLRNAADAGTEQELIADQLPRLHKRLLLLRTAMTALYFSIGMLVLTSMMVGFVQLFHWPAGNWLGILAGLLGTGSLLYGSVLLVREANQAVAATLTEIQILDRSIK